ncbi:uncharacterized protein HD556DRAFT_1309901 [Suillus plorans]|uniref:DUF6532 domain-containing protein n=1 Tax=Suillus plorans TaxID=116603 RepID=A0A9P7DG08_9AGAM|nr:uncharacterized protein HD556DRAFT_1309901 [Suillus plorans]KAG1791308.1 hypothetical protein HD556DRAFT_1309901 [Suillus plorans]
MRDIALPQDDCEQSGADSDDVQDNRDDWNPGDSDADHGNESAGSGASENEDPGTTAMLLFDEVEVASLVTDKQQEASHGTSKSEFVRDRKQMTETPTWVDLDVDDAVSESIEDPTTGGESEFLSDNEDTVPKFTSDTLSQASKTRSMASLVQTEGGKVKLLDQNSETRRLLQSAIVEVKFDKNQVALQTLIAVATKQGVDVIKKHLQSDEQYALQLCSLVDACVPIMRRELKEEACANADGYFCLGHKDTAKARRLLEKLAYIYVLKFDINNDALPVGKKPYQGELLIFLTYWQLFYNQKSVGIKFAGRFIEIANNKAQRPEVPIPLLALVATAVYAALLWKSQGAPSKFNFTGNLFSETYNYHVRFLEKLKKDAPTKFHCMMADIYDAAHKLRYSGANASDHTSELEAFELLDLNNMMED